MMHTSLVIGDMAYLVQKYWTVSCYIEVVLIERLWYYELIVFFPFLVLVFIYIIKKIYFLNTRATKY